MACGLPIVSLAEMGTQDILNNCTAAYIADEDIKQFSQNIINLLNDDNISGTLNFAAKQHAYAWDTKRLTHQMKELYQHTIQEYHGINTPNQ